MEQKHTIIIIMNDENLKKNKRILRDSIDFHRVYDILFSTNLININDLAEFDYKTALLEKQRKYKEMATVRMSRGRN